MSKPDPITSGQVPELTTSDGRSLPLVGAQLRGEARGGLARLVLEQTFANPHDETLHVTYRMPLPADGAVSAYAFELAGRTIVGKVDTKAAAREQFEAAIIEGKTAALLEQNRDDIFTQQLGNLPARARLVAKITVDVRLAWLPEGEWELRFPTVIGPRYIGAADSARDAADTAITVADRLDARVGLELAIGDAIADGRRPASPSHAIATDGGTVTLAQQAQLDRDLVIRWPVARREVGLALDHVRLADGATYGLLTIVPPAAGAKAAAVPRDLIVLLDTSGSMGGMPLDTAKRVVALLIESLGEQDRLELIEFSFEARRWKDEPVAATAGAKREALKWLRAREASGGTEMGSAVKTALSSLRTGAQRQVVLVTDGYVGGEQQIVKQLHERLPPSCRLHVLGIGAAVNRSLATALARAGRGAEVLVGVEEDVERGARRLLDRTRMPVLTNLEILGGALERYAPEHLPDVFEGAPVLAAVKLKPEGGELVVRGDLAHDAWVQRITVPARRPGEGNPAIAALYAREHVADLETRWTIGDQRAIDREIEATGVAFQIATRLTSWVAIDHDSEVDRGTRHEEVPQLLPYGTRSASFGLPQLEQSAAAPMKAMLVTGSYRRAEQPMPMQPSAPMSELLAGAPMKRTHHKARRSLRPLLALVALLALIAALIWWLVL